MSLDERISNLIKRIYCAGEDPDEWDSAGKEVLRLVGAHAGLTTIVDLKRREYDAFRFYGPDDSQFARGVEEYGETYRDDPSLAWASANPGARFCDSSRTVRGDEYLDHPFVKWNRARFGSTHWYVGYTSPLEQLSYSFSVHFPAEQGPGDPQALNLFRLLFDHMECSVRLTRRPFNPESSRLLILLDSTGAVRDLSTAARQRLSKPAPLMIAGGRLIAADQSEQPKLDKALAAVAASSATGASPCAVRLAHPLGRRPWIAAIRPLFTGYGPFGHLRCELLVEIHESLPRIGSLEIMQSLFDLTARELQVVRLLADGHSIESLAQSMAISANTVRTHLRAIFSKTGTSRQSELLQLCAGLAQT